ncbi:MAG: hypothetical protein GX025_02805 [Clostridiales bacterium]|nr:hypothetical protein [Clostridiales bacterium]
MLVLLLVFALIALIDFGPLVRKKSRRGMIGFLTLFTPALILAILLRNKSEVPSLLQAVDNFFKALGFSY